jgi:hypothetical protein
LQVQEQSFVLITGFNPVSKTDNNNKQTEMLLMHRNNNNNNNNKPKNASNASVDNDGVPADPADARDDASGRNLLLSVQVERGQLRQLEKRGARIQEPVDPVTRDQFA